MIVSNETSPSELKENSARIEEGMRQCRGLVADLRHKLSSQSPDAFFGAEDGADEGASNVND